MVLSLFDVAATSVCRRLPFLSDVRALGLPLLLQDRLARDFNRYGLLTDDEKLSDEHNHPLFGNYDRRNVTRCDDAMCFRHIVRDMNIEARFSIELPASIEWIFDFTGGRPVTRHRRQLLKNHAMLFARNFWTLNDIDELQVFFHCIAVDVSESVVYLCSDCFDAYYQNIYEQSYHWYKVRPYHVRFSDETMHHLLTNKDLWCQHCHTTPLVYDAVNIESRCSRDENVPHLITGHCLNR